jgi:hypothetical protein
MYLSHVHDNCYTMLRWPLDCKRCSSLDCERLWVCDTTCRESSIRCRSQDVLSVAAGETLAVVGWGVTLQILSAR